MKKTLFAIAMLAVALVACEKEPEGGQNKLEATLTLAEGVEAAIAEGVAYGSPIAIKGTSSVALTEVVLTGVAKNGNAYAAKGSAQTLEQDGAEIDQLWFADTKEATHVEVKLVAGNKAASFYYALGAVEGEWNFGAWCEPAAVVMADKKIENHANNPELYPEENTGAGSDTPSFISMDGVNVNGTLKHIVSLNELLPVDGAGASFCFCNVLQNTTNNAYIGGERGYAFTDIPTLTAGTIGRQCDVYNYGGHFLNKANCKTSTLSRIVGSWAGNSYDAEEYAFVDGLFLAIPEKIETLADQMRAFYLLGEIQRVLDNSTLGVENEPTSLTNKNMYRRWGAAGDNAASMAKVLGENFRAGDYLIIRSHKSPVEGEPLTYGIIQILQLPDDSSAFVTDEATGKRYIDKTKAEDIFLKPCYLNIKCQMVVAK
ncbi:MAG: hypothetical protein IKA28_06970 [Tidjanibacter sp.]|nr:hypothetical protein [Tidjanibacter sp.]